MKYNGPTIKMGTTINSVHLSNAEQKVKTLQSIISNLQAELKSPNVSKVRKEGIRRELPRHKDALVRAKEELKRAKAEAKKK